MAIKPRLVDDGFGVAREFRCCLECSRWLVTVGNYSPRKRDADRRVVQWHPYCSVCMADKNRARYRALPKRDRTARARARTTRLQEDHDARERQREWERESRRRARETDPEGYRQRRLEYARLDRARLRADPLRAARRREADRMGYKLRQERKGRPLAGQRSAPASMPSEGKGCYRMAAPLLRVLEVHAEAAEMPIESFVAAVGVTSRTVRRWRADPAARCDSLVTDRVLTALGLNPQDVWDA